ncbi:MAG: fibronectin type III domain-containing protein [Verrucomicrobia bacterium]|nr:fibronectin type III domain-containing protein [Verrucomicrobiota bacterium]
MHVKQKQKSNKRFVLIIGRRRRGTVPVSGPPAAPFILGLEAASTYLRLSWADLADNEEGFRIYRRAFDDPFEVVAEVLADQTEFYDGNVDMGVVYTYYLVAFSSGVESAPSNEVSGELTLSA